jgi:23S rRNA (cytidine1920-2'-O)/16S rRNA (cytidine1409-2'-O)-methyltransferase
MLQNGAVKVFAVDVGHGQLAWSLRNDPRVICMEKTNIRYVVPEDIGCAVDFVSIDVSFISLTKVLVPVKELMAERGQIVCLIKPQFEAGREKVGKKGVVREKETHMEVVRMVMDFALSIGFGVLGLAFSPIKGPEGNIEYLLYLQKTPTEEELNRPLPDVKAVSCLGGSYEAFLCNCKLCKAAHTFLCAGNKRIPDSERRRVCHCRTGSFG